MAYPRVLHVIGSLEPGGTERQLVGFIQRSGEPGRHHVVVCSPGGELEKELPRSPDQIGPLKREFLGVPSGIRTVAELHRLISRIEPDIVHTHLGYPQVLASIAVPRGVPIIASRRGRTPYLESSGFGRMLVGVANRRTRLLLTNSHDLARRAASERWTPPSRVIPNGVDLDRFTPAPFPETGSPTVVMLARMRAEKRHDRFLRVFRRVVDQLPDARAILVGDGPCRDDVARLVGLMGLSERVDLVGGCGDPRSQLARSHVVTLTSDHEGFPNALLEGMAMGRPIVATDVGGVAELVGDQAGITIPRDAEPQMAAAMVSLLSDPSAQMKVGLAARHRAEEYGWEAVVRGTESAYQVVLSNRSAIRCVSATSHA